MRSRSLSLVCALVALGGATACSPGNRDVACRPITRSASAKPAGSPFRGTVFTIVMENQSRDEILGGDGPAYIRSLARDYTVAAGYSDAFVHPSEPNYLWMAAGENFGVLSDEAPSANHVRCASHIADQIEAAGLTWRTYQESMGPACTLRSRYPYEPKHNPFIYFDDINGWNGHAFARPKRCTDHVVDYKQLDVDLASGHLPSYVFITPNMIHDMHDGSISDGDAWLAREVPKILASPAFKNGGVLFLTWDEGDFQGNDPPMIVISPLAKRGYVSSVPYDSSSYLKTVETILGLEPLPCNPAPDTVATMDDLFTVRLPKN